MPYETRAVLAAAYPWSNPPASLSGHTPSRNMLTHVIETDDTGAEIKVLCGRVRLDSIADSGAEDVNSTPSCAICARRLARIKANGG